MRHVPLLNKVSIIVHPNVYCGNSLVENLRRFFFFFLVGINSKALTLGHLPTDNPTKPEYNKLISQTNVP